MEPYYQHGQMTIYNGDCREVLPTLLRHGTELLLTDPPYGINYTNEKFQDLHRHIVIEHAPIVGDDKPFNPAHLLKWAKGCPIILWGGHCYASRLPDSRSWLCWVKSSRDNADIRQADYELAWANCIGRSRIFHHLWMGAYKASESGERAQHPTQKPVELMRWCCNLVLDAPGAWVIDPYMGSGSTLVAAKSLGHYAIGIEIEERYCEIAAQRLSQDVLLWGDQGNEIRT